MSDFTSDGWGYFVTIVTLASIAGCAVLLFALGRMRVTRAKDGAPVETTGHVWDGDLAEYNNPLPRWWMWLFYATIVFSLGYLVLYPGLGRAPGTLGWTSVGAYASEVKTQDAKVQPLYAKYRAMDVMAVAADPEARAMGERLFLNYCAQCHGSDAGGSKGSGACCCTGEESPAAQRCGDDIDVLPSREGRGRHPRRRRQPGAERGRESCSRRGWGCAAPWSYGGRLARVAAV